MAHSILDAPRDLPGTTAMIAYTCRYSDCVCCHYQGPGADECIVTGNRCRVTKPCGFSPGRPCDHCVRYAFHYMRCRQDRYAQNTAKRNCWDRHCGTVS